MANPLFSLIFHKHCSPTFCDRFDSWLEVVVLDHTVFGWVLTQRVWSYLRVSRNHQLHFWSNDLKNTSVIYQLVYVFQQDHCLPQSFNCIIMIIKKMQTAYNKFKLPAMQNIYDSERKALSCSRSKVHAMYPAASKSLPFKKICAIWAFNSLTQVFMISKKVH